MDENRRRMVAHTASSSSLPASPASGGAAGHSPAPELASIKVFCRLRQQNQLEKREGASQCSTVLGGRTMFLRNERCDVDEIRCTFDRVFDTHCTQEEVYTHTAKPLVHEFLQGYNCTIFAYGQTGSGKTHTILGPKDGVPENAEDEGGIISRVAADLYQEAARATADPIEITVSFVEIYMEQVRDLLSPNTSTGGGNGSLVNGGLKIRESAQHGVYIEEMARVRCKSEVAMMELVKSGTLSRAVSSTRMNKDSSRSHTILMLSCVRPTSGRRATMYIVDLAGSELVNKTNASGRVLQEAKAINKSLSALSNVIKALGDGKRHVPYRDSKLTRLLQDSLGGTAKTCLILAASCSSYNMPETISTLRFGLRAKEIKNPVVQRHEASGREGAAAGFASGGIIFKELYQRAMEDMEAKNRKIDELQRLLSAKYQENQHSDEAETSVENESELVTVIPDDGELQEVEGREGDRASQEEDEENEEGGEEESGENSEEDESEDDDPEQVHAKEREKLELANQALEEENKRLFVVLEALESKLDEVVVDLSTGRPILSLSDPPSSSCEGDDAGGSNPGETRETASPSLKVWLESDTWRKSLESRPDLTVAQDVEHQARQPSSSFLNLDTSSPCIPTESPIGEAVQPQRHVQGDVPPSGGESVAPVSVQTTLKTECTPAHCTHLSDAEALSRQIVELKLQLHYLTENARLSLEGENYSIVVENAQLKTRLEELEFQANLCNVACSQLEMKNRACETRLSNQETHIGCLQNSLQEYQGLFKQQIIMSQEKCRLLTDELEFYKKLARCSQENYQHLSSGGTSPGRRSKTNKAPSPRKNGSNGATSRDGATAMASVEAATLPVSSFSLEGTTSTDPAGTTGSSSPGLWRGFSNLCKPGRATLNDERDETPVVPLSARAQRLIVKPLSDRAQGAVEQATKTLSATSPWRKTSVDSPLLSLDELAGSTGTMETEALSSPPLKSAGTLF